MYASQFGQGFHDSAGFGWEVASRSHRWTTLTSAKDAEIARLETVYRQLLMKAGVKIFAGRAQIAGPHRVEVNGTLVTARVILVATGAAPQRLSIPGADLAITSNEVFSLPAAPRRIAIIGGGYIACEFSGIFNGLGSQVVQLHRGDQVLRGFDAELRDCLAGQIKESGVDLRLNTKPMSIERRGGTLAVSLSTGETLEVDVVMAATGRQPNSAGIGLQAGGVDLDGSGAIKVDEYSRTSNRNIYAVGDVTNRLNLTPAAIHEGHAFADTVFGDSPRPCNHENVPCAVFSQPQAASVGLSESQARACSMDVAIYVSTFRPMRSALSKRNEKALVKLVVDATTKRVLGAHIVGADAAEIIQGIAIAIKAGATKADFDATLGVHPTLAEEFVTLRDPR